MRTKLVRVTCHTIIIHYDILRHKTCQTILKMFAICLSFPNEKEKKKALELEHWVIVFNVVKKGFCNIGRIDRNEQKRDNSPTN